MSERQRFEFSLATRSGHVVLELTLLKIDRALQDPASILDQAGCCADGLVQVSEQLLALAGHPAAPTLPKFRYAQQALAYLHLSLDADRLAVCFSGETDEVRLRKAQTALDLMQVASMIDEEIQALVQAGPLIEYLFRTEVFQQVATAEERIAGRYILARAAMFRLAYEHGED